MSSPRSQFVGSAFSIVLAALVVGFLPPLSGATAGTAPRLPTAPSGSSDVPAVLLQPAAERYGYDAQVAQAVVAPTPATGRLAVAVTLWPSNPAFYLPPGPGASALTPSEVGALYGESPAQYAALAQYFQQQGLAVTHLWPDRLAISVEGPAQRVAAAFRTTEMTGVVGDRALEFAATPPSLPSPFDGEVASVAGLTSGLSTFTVPLRDVTPAPTAVATQPSQGRTTPVVTASAVHLIYGLDALYNYSGTPHWASGVGIALLLWGDGYAPSDLDSFFSNDYPSELPTPLIKDFPVDGAPAPSAAALRDPSTGPQELTLDMEWAGSEAPGATLDAVYAPDGPASNGYSPTDPSMIDAVNEVVNSVPGVKVLSMSFGTNDGSDSAFQTAFTNAFHQATLEGITILAASGDNGGLSGKNCTGSTDPQFPSTSPDVVAVGGTAPILAENGFGGVTGLDSEPAWSDSGGGYSVAYSAPSWQLVGSAAAPIRAAGMRAGPDVAGPASNNEFFFNGGPAFGEGTSFATPVWAGLIAEMDAVRGKSLGFVTPHLYAVGASEGGGSTGGLVDITSGANCLGPAGSGWDTATGWGSPRALPLFESIAGTFVQTALSANPVPVAPGATLTAAVVVENATTSRPLSGLSVFVQLDSVAYSGPCGGTLATATGSTDSNGSFSVGLPIPGCYFGTTVSLTVTVSGSGYYGSNQTNVAVNLDGISGVLAALQQYPYNVIGFVLIMVAATGVGLLLSSRHRRRINAARSRAPPPANGGSASAAPGSSTGPTPPTGSSSTGSATAVRVAKVAPKSPAPTALGTAVAAPVAARPAAVADPAPTESPAADLAPPVPPPGAMGEPVLCPSCSAIVPVGWTTCPKCGADVPA